MLKVEEEIVDHQEGKACNASTVAVAVKGNSKSKYIVSWALEKFIPEGVVIFKLLHVRPRITTVPTASKPLPL